MIKNTFALLYFIFLFRPLAFTQSQLKNEQKYWSVQKEGISWNVINEKRLPHQDNIEFSGRRVAAIISYEIDTLKRLKLHRDIIFPQLRVFLNISESSWKKYWAYLRRTFEDDVMPAISISTINFLPGILDSVNINGKISFFHHASQGIKVTRTMMPSMSDRLFIEKWQLINTTDSVIQLDIGTTEWSRSENGWYGAYLQKITCDAGKKVVLKPKDQYEFAIYFSAFLNEESQSLPHYAKVEREREQFLEAVKNDFVLQTPDPVINKLFQFSKIRAAESLFETKMGLVHSPGGGRYYTGIWANDQAEYSGPFFPYLGYAPGNEAALNAYRMFLKNIPGQGGKIWSSFEMQGELQCCSKDRGDAAMIAFGVTHFLLASGNKKYAEELWPLLEWCLNYCESKKNQEGVITSDSDELEGRFSTGKANLSTSSLYYAALNQAVFVAKGLGKYQALINSYSSRAKALEHAIEKYFGAAIEGLQTYRYHEGSNVLRSWICLPLVVGISNRKQGTLDALFSKLWSDNGVRIEYNPGSALQEVFWDRGTLYAFRGAFKASAADLALQKLQTYSASRLTGFHVPYVVEAWPEGSMAHLSAESALYCRVFSEGLLGLTPTGFNCFDLHPVLPSLWNNYVLKNIKAFNTTLDITVKDQTLF